MTCITVGAGKEFTIAEEGAERTLNIVHVYNTKDKEGCPPEGLRVHYGSTCKQDEAVNVLVKEANTGNLLMCTCMHPSFKLRLASWLFILL